MEEKVKVTPIDSRTWHIVDGEKVSAYMFLLEGDERAALIDTGFSNFDVAALARTLTEKPVFVINTHGHLDHIAANHQFKEVYMHPADEETFREHSDYHVRYEYLKALLGEFGKPVSLLEDAQYRDKVERLCRLAPADNRRPIAEGDVFDLGGRHLRVIETPGHTRGSVCVLDEERRWLFTGDTVCDQGVLLHLPHSAGVEAFLASIEKLESLSGSFDAMWPGHHRLPVEKQIFSRYIACARRILAGESGTVVHSAAGRGQVLTHDGISLSFL